jgi:hypothetical protein
LGDLGEDIRLSFRAEGLDGMDGFIDIDRRKSLNPAKPAFCPFRLVLGLASADAVLGEGNDPDGMTIGESDSEGNRTRETDRSELVD